MLAQIETLKQDHEAISRQVALLQSFDPSYTLDGFFEDFNDWLASLDATPSNDILEDMADYFTGIH